MAQIIDITDTVEKMKTTFILSAQEYLIALALTYVGPFGAWLVKALVRPFLGWVLGRLVEWPLMQAFFLNTAIRKGSQAVDYVEAVDRKHKLPPTASEVEYANAEMEELRTFRDFVLVSN